MNTLMIVLFFGCLIGMFVGSRILQSQPPQITIVQVEQPPARQRGCLSLIIGIAMVLAALSLIANG